MAEDKEEKKEEHKQKAVPVKVVEQRGESALVEWQAEGDLCRAYVPAAKVKDDRCGQDDLAKGIPYGAPWEDLLGPVAPEAVGKQLRQQGIWTSTDIERNIQRVQRAINVATGLTPASLHTLAKQYETKEK